VSPRQITATAALFATLIGCGDSDSSAPDVPIGPILDVAPRVTKPPPRVGAGALDFVDVTEGAGIDTPTANSVAFVDFNDDGWPDLTVGTALGVYLLRNNGDGTFVNETLRISIPRELRGEVSTTVYGDVNGDGHLDLYVGRWRGSDFLLMSDGAGSFKPNPDAGIPEAIGVRGVNFGDTDGDGDLDLYVCIGRDLALGFGETGDGGGPDKLFTNNGGVFTDSGQPVGGKPKGETFGALMVDFDRDADLDLFVVTASDLDRYYRNDGGVFTNVSEAAGIARWTNLMGLAVGDYDGDNLLDVYGTDSIPDALYKGQGNGTFTNVYPAVLGGEADPSAAQTAWGCAFMDADNDGDQDVLTVAAYDDNYHGRTGPPRVGRFVLLENDGAGGMTDATDDAGAALNRDVNGGGLAVADYDLDGDIDVAVALAEPGKAGEGAGGHDVLMGLRLLRNDGLRAPGNRSLRIELRQDGPNKWAVGATIDVVTASHQSSRAVTAGESYLSANDFAQHFGMGSSSAAKVDVRWPDGRNDTVELKQGNHRIVRTGDVVTVEPAGTTAATSPGPILCDLDCQACQALCDAGACIHGGHALSGVACLVDCWLSAKDGGGCGSQ